MIKKLKFILLNKHPKLAYWIFRSISKLRRRKITNENQGSIVTTIDLPTFRNTFFGYYDKSSFNPVNANLIIFHANNQKAWKFPSKKVKTSIILYNCKNQKFDEISKTTAWNWQQGSRLHWINSDEFIFNNFDYSTGKYYSEIYNIESKDFRRVDVPVQDSYKDEFLISLSYEALRIARPDYGYFCSRIKQKKLTEQQLIYYDLKNNITKNLLSVKDVIEQLNINFNKRDIKLARLNHVSISPTGEKFVFLFRYYNKSILYHYLFEYTLMSNHLKVLVNNEMISHYYWKNDIEVIFWGNINGIGDYYIINTNTSKIDCVNTSLNDGHPTILDEGRFITDAYPDILGYRNLYLIDFKNSQPKLLFSSFEPAEFQMQSRCDLHPNCSNKYNMVNFDSITDNRRILKILDLKENI